MSSSHLGKALHSVVKVLTPSRDVEAHASSSSASFDLESIRKPSWSARFSASLSGSRNFRTQSISKVQRDLLSLNRDWPTDASAYELLEDCGRGVTATVHRALCKTLGEFVAVKKMDLENLMCKMDEIIKEAQLLKQYQHPNVLPLYCSFVSGEELWMVMPFIGNGSLQKIMHTVCPDGLEETVIATILRDVLKALTYVHNSGAIHRDVKAGNILIGSEGRVMLADFGVSAQMERGASWDSKGSRNTFVGTPCWMAPEVMEQMLGYDSSADIWSCGITIIEMATGHAPFAHFSPMKIVMLTLQKPPPILEDTSKRTYSKAIKEVAALCLQKDPKLRPTAAQLLDHKFFKLAMDDEYLVKHLLSRLPVAADPIVSPTSPRGQPESSTMSEPGTGRAQQLHDAVAPAF